MQGRKLLHGGDYNPEQWLDRPEEIDEVMKSGEVQLVVAFGQNFSGGMLSPDGSQMQLIVLSLIHI